MVNKKKLKNSNNFHLVAAKTMNTFSNYTVHSPHIDDNRKMTNEYMYVCTYIDGIVHN